MAGKAHQYYGSKRLRPGEGSPNILNFSEKPSWSNTKLVEEHNEFPLSIDQDEYRMNRGESRRVPLEKAGFLPAPQLPIPILKELQKIRIVRSEEGRIPASAILVDGSRLDRVVFVKVDNILECNWDIPFWTTFVRADKIVGVSPSHFTMPVFARKAHLDIGEVNWGS